MTETHEKYMYRCIQLAKKGLGSVSPNPMVGSVIVYKDLIIGEGYHRKYGEPHAEVIAVNAVQNKNLLRESTMYVSLEPCSHYGKTPPCADMIIENGIPEVIIGSIDPNPKVKGGGIKKLRDAGIKVKTGILSEECKELNIRFFTYHNKKRPYIILKWAETADGFIDICRKDPEKIKYYWITNEYCKTLVHKWRTEEDAFMIGTNTVINDNPQLTARNYRGRNPVRVVIDNSLKTDLSFRIYDDSAKTIVLNSLKNEEINNNIKYIKTDFSANSTRNIIKKLYEQKIQSVVIEGGAYTLEQFINEGLWDEARVFIGSKVFKKGVAAPSFKFLPFSEQTFDDSCLKIYRNSENETIF